MQNRYAKLAKFVVDEAKRRGMSLRRFAKFVGVSSATIQRMALDDNEIEPSLESLILLSQATGVDLCSIIALIAPEQAHIRPEVLILSQRIERLPANVRGMIDDLIVRAVLTKENEAD